MGRVDWFPSDKNELNALLDRLLSDVVPSKQEIHGLVVPHAGYTYSGEVAAKAYGLLKGRRIRKAIVFGPSHYASINGLATLKEARTPLGPLKITANALPKLDYEHAIQNQLPFLQRLGCEEVLPVVVGEITMKTAQELAKGYMQEKALLVFSTDLSHFLPSRLAVSSDKRTLEILEQLEVEQGEDLDACGRYPLFIMMALCRLMNYRPSLVEYKNSGDITGDISSVVGYASLTF